MTARGRKKRHAKQSHAGVVVAESPSAERVMKSAWISEATEVAGVKRQRVLSPVEALYRKQKDPLSQRQYDAAQRLSDDYEVGVLGAKPGREDMPAGIQNSGGQEGYTITQLTALRRYELAIQAIGLRKSSLLCALVLNHEDLKTIAGRSSGLDANPTRLRGKLDLILDDLADHYGF